MNTRNFNPRTCVDVDYNKGICNLYKKEGYKVADLKEQYNRLRRRISKTVINQELELLQVGEVFQPKVPVHNKRGRGKRNSGYFGRFCKLNNLQK